MLKKIFVKVKKEALSIITIILLVVYVIISYRTYITQQTRLEIDRLTYQMILQLEDELELQQEILESLKNQNQNSESLVEALEHLYNQLINFYNRKSQSW